MNTIDDDAKELGINQELWKEFKEKHKVEQPEFESVTNPIDDKEAFIRHKQAMTQRWFSYYKKCKSKRNTIIDQYNKIALMKQR